MKLTFQVIKRNYHDLAFKEAQGIAICVKKSVLYKTLQQPSLIAPFCQERDEDSSQPHSHQLVACICSKRAKFFLKRCAKMSEENSKYKMATIARKAPGFGNMALSFPADLPFFAINYIIIYIYQHLRCFAAAKEILGLKAMHLCPCVGKIERSVSSFEF